MFTTLGNLLELFNKTFSIKSQKVRKTKFKNGNFELYHNSKFMMQDAPKPAEPESRMIFVVFSAKDDANNFWLLHNFIKVHSKCSSQIQNFGQIIS